MKHCRNSRGNFRLFNISVILEIIIMLCLVCIVPSFNTFCKADDPNNVNWEATIDLYEDGGRSDYVVFGEVADASDGMPYDSYDVPKGPFPPGPPYIRSWFNDSLTFPYNALWSDYRNFPDTSKVWDLYIRWEPYDGESPTNLTISWNRSDVCSSEYVSIALYDYGESVTIAEMKNENSYEYEALAKITYHFQIIATNTPPNTPNTPNPSDGAADVGVDTDLSWSGGDPDDGDIVSYDVYFGTSSPPPKIVDNQSSTSHNHGTLEYATTYYWNIVAWDNHGVSTQGPIWSFTTLSSGGDGDGDGDSDGDGDGDGDGINLPPIANASAGEPYQGFINSEILFNATFSSDPDNTGYIKSWEWDFGDETNESGEIVLHSYSEPGTYTVTLTVTDDKDANDSCETSAIIRKPSLPPKKPIIDGPLTGNKEIEYFYTAKSTDPDNDTIQYIFDWDDGEITTTDFVTNGTLTTQPHIWAEAGIYIIKVKATDNETYSGEAKRTILIDACLVGDLGYCVDIDGDGIYDLFRDDTAGIETTVKQQKNKNYLVDMNGDSKWDYIFDSETGMVTVVSDEDTTGEIPWSIVAIILIALVVIGVVLYYYKK